MMDTRKELELVVEKYKEAIHNQNKQDFYEIWSENTPCRLISIGNEYEGLDSIYEDFLIGRIQNAYEEIVLISEEKPKIQILGQVAVVVFRYHTECIRRNSGERTGIRGIETQIMIQENGEWKLNYVHYSKVD